MRLLLGLVGLLGFLSCAEEQNAIPFQEVEIKIIHTDSASIRALEYMPGSVAFAGSNGLFGNIDLKDYSVRTNRISHEADYPEFRAVAHTSMDFFMLSAGDPALLYKTGDAGEMELVYSETGPDVFYDSMGFWDDLNGIAVGDAMGGCLSILISRDGGKQWDKIPCTQLPEALPGEGAFAASDTNLALVGDSVWIVSNKGRVYFSPDKGESWNVQQSPVTSNSETYGLYSLAFYDADLGYSVGGDYTKPEDTPDHKIRTQDGGMTWTLSGQGEPPGYMSCVQYVPGRSGRDLVGVSYGGIYYSNDFGATWNTLSREGFYSLRFTDGFSAIASGNGRIARILFK